MNIAHPTLQARDIASLIDNDPIMASQIKEFIREERLIECLGLTPASFSREDLSDEMDRRVCIGE